MNDKTMNQGKTAVRKVQKMSWAMALLGAVAAVAGAKFAMAQTAAGPYTEAQAATGRAAFNQSCAPCHGGNLAGNGMAPQLSGDFFIGKWGRRSTQELFNEIKLSMPLGNPNTLGDETYSAIVAYILKANGAQGGTAAFNSDTKVTINTVANGKTPTDIAQTPRVLPATPAPATPSRRAAPVARTGLTVAKTVQNYTSITDAMMLNPPENDWLMHYRNYAGWSNSPLKQINRDNVGTLQLRWVWALDEGERQQITPLVHDGVMFLSTNHTNVVQALNAATGDLIWENRIGPTLTSVENATRTMVLYGDKIFYPATDGKLYALDARTGKIVWQHAETFPGNKIGGMLAAKGKLITGTTRCGESSVAGHCFVAAYDANTGAQVWKFITVADKGTPGGDTWDNLPDADRVGADTWIAGTYDPALNLVYFGTGQAKGKSRGLLKGDALYTNSTVALDVDTGKLVWYHQDTPDRGLDLDEVYERVLVDHGDQKSLITVGKKGIMWKLDRTTGKFLDYRAAVFQNVVTKIDRKTGRSTLRPDIVAATAGDIVAFCPSQQGGHDWPATSYDPNNDLMILPLAQSCVMSGSGGGNYEMPGTDGNTGRLSAYDAKTFKPVWTMQQRASFLTSAMTTAGGIGFVGDWDRRVRAFDVKTGKTLWETRLGTTAAGYPTTFSVNGEQFVAIPTGYNGGSPQQRSTMLLSGELNRPTTGHAVYVFALPKKY